LHTHAGTHTSSPSLFCQVLAASLQTDAAENKVFEIVSALSVKALPEDKWFSV
jgi:hypothetical protein